MIRIPVGGGLTLGADLFLPPSGEPAPAVVALMAYRRDLLGGAGCRTTLQRFAAAGYAVLLVDPLGLGSSDGRARVAFDPAEADDGVAAVEWAARQPWCSGSVGLWGFSYGALLALRTAGRQPAGLRAVVSLMGFLDPERDWVHPGGVRGAVGPLGVWGLGSVVNQLLPPTEFRDPAEQARWRARLADGDPYLVDLAPPGDPVWRTRVVDPAAVTVPTLSVGGWRDMFCDAAVRIHEGVRGPSGLLMGPWMHSAPDDAPDEPADATLAAIRWWDRWLRGAGPDPAVTVYVSGHSPGWRSLPAWPPPSTVEPGPSVAGPVPADPTLGPLSGLWGVPNGGYGRPLDQHEDDARSLSGTGPVLSSPLLLAGRPSVTLCGPTGRLVLKLTDVDPDGRSTLITGAVVGPGPAKRTVRLDPACHRVGPGHRLRITVSAAAFPRVWPVLPGPDDDPSPVRDLALSLPVAADDGEPVTVERPPAAPRWATGAPRWEIVRDVVGERVTVVVGDTLQATLPGGHTMEQEVEIRASAGAPGTAQLVASHTAALTLAGGEEVVVRASLLCTELSGGATGAVSVDGVTVAARSWSVEAVPGDQRGQEQHAGRGQEQGVEPAGRAG